MSGNVEINSHTPSIVTGTFGTNGTLSEEFDLSGYVLAGLLIDNASNGTLNFLVSDQPYASGDRYRRLVDNTGAVAALTCPSGNVGYTASVVLNIIQPYRYVRILSSVAQANAPTARWIVKA